MRLDDLLPEAPATLGGLDVTGATADSRAVAPGFLFFAIAGARADGLSYAAQALEAGAVAIVGETPPQGALAEAPFVQVADVRAALARVAAALHWRQPHTIVAVTGTSGKTSVADFTRQIFAACGHAAASLGTIGVVKPSGAVYGSLTTPDPVTLHRTLDELASEGVTHLAMEASSHGLDQRRLDGVRLTAGAFTNLSRDHLDYHADLDDYLRAKLRLFDTLLHPGQTAVVAADHEVSSRVIEAARAHGLRVFSVGFAGEDIRLLDMQAEGFSLRLDLLHAGRQWRVLLPLAGGFQAENALVAAGLAIAVGCPAEEVFAALEHLRGAPGRLEPVGDKLGESGGAPVFVDYAHKPDALDKALAALRPFAQNRLVVVFGCGGDRDRGKRPLMGEIAARGADLVIVTDDSPRSEDAASIRAAILDAARAVSPNVREIADRSAAINAAVALLLPGDVLLIAGKGHETGQIVGKDILPFDDRAEARAALAGWIEGGDFLWSGLGLVAPLQARVSGLAPQGVTGVSIDTRTLKAGELYFAIRGDNSDGHDYVARAFERGAAAAVVDEAHVGSLQGLGSLYVVRDVLKSLEGLGFAARRRSRAKIIAVTGSVGKTSTKEALRKVLSDAGPTHASDKSYNNHWGVPLMLARLPESARFAVFEIGMNHAGEIAALVDLVRPHVAVVTTVAPVHLEHFAGLDDIARAKAEIFSGVVKGGVAVVNRDIATFPILETAAKESPAAYLLTFGAHEEADARLLSYEPEDDGSRVVASVLGVELTYRLGAPGRHSAENSLAVLLAARAAGLDLAAAAASLAEVAAPQGRGARESLRLDPESEDSEILLIDESYNANPASMRAAIELLGAAPVAGEGRRIAALGDMLELGPSGPELHEALGADLLRAGVDLVFAVGPLSRHLFDSLPQDKRGAWAEDAARLEPEVAAALRPGDVLMVKGSNGSLMHKLVASLKARYAAPQKQKIEV